MRLVHAAALGVAALLLASVTALTSPKLDERRLRPGDEIITVAAGFPTTVAPILQNRLIPVFVDVNLGDYTAKPEELRVFLEEAAGVSKYRERRRETELRLRDTRENLPRVDDIRQELDKQLTHLQGQAEVATPYHALQTQVTGTQHLLWFVRRQESAATRNRHAREIERLGNELEAETARLRDAERRLDELRNQHYRSGDEMYAAQGALYETNAEIARVAQQIAHIRENRSRVEQQIGGINNQISTAQAQLEQSHASLAEWREEHARAEARVAACEARIAEERSKLPVAEEAWRATSARRDELQQAVGRAEQSRQVEQTKLAHASRVLEQLAARNARLHEEQNGLEKPDTAALEALQTQVGSVWEPGIPPTWPFARPMRKETCLSNWNL